MTMHGREETGPDADVQDVLQPIREAQNKNRSSQCLSHPPTNTSKVSPWITSDKAKLCA